MLRTLAALSAFALSVACADAQSVGPDYPEPPSITYGPLYRAVELGWIFPDSKTFPDMIPGAFPTQVLEDYDVAKRTPGFSLANFVNQYFSGPEPAGPTI